MPTLRMMLRWLQPLVVLGLGTWLPGCSLFDASTPPPETVAPVVLSEPLATTRFPLPAADVNVIGELQVIRLREQDTLIDVAMAYQLGFDELVAANPGVDPWLPGEGREILLPTRFVLPDAPRQGIVLNVPTKRLFYYPKPAKGAAAEVHTFPVSIGREGWATPYGLTRITSKRKDPAWHVPASIRKEHAENGDPLPAVVPAGPDNPLGAYAMRLGFPGSYLIHGTNKPAGIGIRASHGCIRMNPQHIEWLYQQAAVGTPVRVVNQPLLLGVSGEELLLEAHAPLDEDKTRHGEALKRAIGKQLARIGSDGAQVDPERIARISGAQRGVPLSIMNGGFDLATSVAGAPRVRNLVSYDWFDGDAAGGEPLPAADASPLHPR